ncbi:DUF6461 domain-containing protein [Streptomyces sp. NPDC005732]|uniref:DUF6461 domain-containing protein n=1 Tax=Streptomyces sp. NPDC005732 TaxID=3157057 RepID=UPI0033C6D0E1
MPTPGFPPDTLSSEGLPVWIGELADEVMNHSLHVVRGLEPAQALRALGVEPRSIETCELPAAKPDERTSLPRAALGNAPEGAAGLLAGRVGEWTFVYDDSGYTFDGSAEALSAGGRTAVTSVYTLNGDASLDYAVDGEIVEEIFIDDLSLEEDLPGLPAELRAAFEAAGTADREDLEPGEADSLIAMRATCALAGLALTLDAVRRVPLLVAPLDEAD